MAKQTLAEKREKNRLWMAQKRADIRAAWEKEHRALCACGCGEFVLYPTSRFLHGHQIKVDKPAKVYCEASDGTDTPKKYERASKRTHKKCTKCHAIKSKEHFDTKTVTDIHGGQSVHLFSYCKECARDKVRKYRANASDEQIDRWLEYARQWRVKNKEKERKRNLLYSHGLTVTQYEEMKAAQNGLCLICGTGSRNLVVDHCHATKTVRALLCPQCNSALGLLREEENTILSMLTYVRKFCQTNHSPTTTS